MKNKDSFIITIPNEISSEKERYFNEQVANLLGQLFFQYKYKINYQYFCNLPNNKEIYYSIEDLYRFQKFGRALLMPKDIFIKQVKENTIENEVNTKNIASYFKVPMGSVSNRGQDLGIFK